MQQVGGINANTHIVKSSSKGMGFLHRSHGAQQEEDLLLTAIRLWASAARRPGAQGRPEASGIKAAWP